MFLSGSPHEERGDRVQKPILKLQGIARQSQASMMGTMKNAMADSNEGQWPIGVRERCGQHCCRAEPSRGSADCCRGDPSQNMAQARRSKAKDAWAMATSRSLERWDTQKLLFQPKLVKGGANSVHPGRARREWVYIPAVSSVVISVCLPHANLVPNTQLGRSLVIAKENFDRWTSDARY